eukprot:TRINITY_DN12547_c0_g1_i5.p2 TRINITY_DN12547_c0_g1~~TRINITY_DN12547_c0_g1_i5.p2  ORF type:complete len:131 (+),score=19.39 TRINITY_DN12547_c0_g1_i5:436-828(+)
MMFSRPTCLQTKRATEMSHLHQDRLSHGVCRRSWQGMIVLLVIEPQIPAMSSGRLVINVATLLSGYPKHWRLGNCVMRTVLQAFHKNCFRCLTCKTVLKATNYCCTDDSRFYCKTHYMAAVNAGKSIDDM